MKWLARFARGGARPVLSRGASVAAFGQWPQNYEAQVREGYGRNAVAQRAVKLVAEAVAAAPIAASDEALGGLVQARSNGQALLETLAAQLLLHGNCYAQILRDADGRAVELFALRPERVGEGRWRLGELWRGRRGTEAAIGRQVAGDRFVLIEADSVAALDLPLSSLGGTVRLLASGIGDGAGPAEADTTISGASVLPPMPVHMRAQDDGAGGWAVSWVRRSRAGWRWIDGVDAPLVEEREAYRVTVDAGTASRTFVANGPAVSLSAAESSAGSVTVTVRQIGSYGESGPASLTIV